MDCDRQRLDSISVIMVKIEPRREVGIGLHQQSDVRLSDAHGEESTVYSLDEFKTKLQMSVVKCTDEDLEFDIIGINPAIANAIRRILIAEVSDARAVFAQLCHYVDSNSFFSETFMAIACSQALSWGSESEILKEPSRCRFPPWPRTASR